MAAFSSSTTIRRSIRISTKILAQRSGETRRRLSQAETTPVRRFSVAAASAAVVRDRVRVCRASKASTRIERAAGGRATVRARVRRHAHAAGLGRPGNDRASVGRGSERAGRDLLGPLGLRLDRFRAAARPRPTSCWCSRSRSSPSKSCSARARSRASGSDEQLVRRQVAVARTGGHRAHRGTWRRPIGSCGTSRRTMR